MDIIFEIDKREIPPEAQSYFQKLDQSVNNTRFKVGDRVTFKTGYNDDLGARAVILAISGHNIYVYRDCYWFPIQDEEKRGITLV